MKSTIIFIVIFILGVSAIGYLYFFKEIPQQETVEPNKYINIYAYDENIAIQTGYKIYVGSNEIKNGTTQTKGGVRENIPMNRDIIVENYNLEEQNFYTSSKTFHTSNLSNNYLAELNLKESGTFEIYDYEQITSNNYLSIYLKPNGLIRHPGFCLKASAGFLLITPVDDKINTIILDRFEDYDTCYTLGLNILENEIEIELEYLLFNEFNNDNIKFVFFDGDKINGWVLYDSNIGATDLLFTLE